MVTSLTIVKLDGYDDSNLHQLPCIPQIRETRPLGKSGLVKRMKVSKLGLLAAKLVTGRDL